MLKMNSSRSLSSSEKLVCQMCMIARCMLLASTTSIANTHQERAKLKPKSSKINSLYLRHEVRASFLSQTRYSRSISGVTPPRSRPVCSKESTFESKNYSGK